MEIIQKLISQPTHQSYYLQYDEKAIRGDGKSLNQKAACAFVNRVHFKTHIINILSFTVYTVESKGKQHN